MEENKKQRRPNWERVELEKLVDGVENHYVTLCGRFSASLTNSTKTKLWEEIAISVNAVKGFSRSVEECQTKWTHIKSEAKRKEKERLRYKNGTGGGPPPKEATCLELRILKLLPQESVSGISGALEVSGPNHIHVAAENETSTDNAEQFAGENEVKVEVMTLRKRLAKPTKKLRTSLVSSPQDSYLDLLRQQIEVDKERNEKLRSDAAARRELERSILQIHKDILAEKRKKYTNELFHSLLNES